MTSTRKAGISIRAEGLQKRFTGRSIFSPLSFEIEPSRITAIVGRNGSGKSTLLRIIAGLLEPSKGKFQWIAENAPVSRDDYRLLRGYVAPYLELYDELTALEHVHFIANVKGVSLTRSDGEALLERFGLSNEAIASERRLRVYSSGMRQRVRLAMAAVGEPSVLFLDEPTSNLDREGIEILFEFLREREMRGCTIILATNEPREVELAQTVIELTDPLTAIIR